MSAYFFNGKLRFDHDGTPTDQELLLGTLVIDPRQSRKLQEEFLGHELNDGHEPVSTADALVLIDEVALIKNVAKNRVRPESTYVIDVAGDMALGAVGRLIETTGLAPAEQRPPVSVVGLTVR